MQDTYSPITGHWGIAGAWDVVFVGLAVGVLALLALVVATTRRGRLMAFLALLALIPAAWGAQVLGDVRVGGPDGKRFYCVGGGPLDLGDSCGWAYLERYVMVMAPLALLLLLLASYVVLQVRARVAGRRLAGGLVGVMATGVVGAVVARRTRI